MKKFIVGLLVAVSLISFAPVVASAQTITLNRDLVQAIVAFITARPEYTAPIISFLRSRGLAEQFVTIYRDNNSAGQSVVNDAPKIAVISPNGGETYIMGSQVVVRWDSEDVDNHFISYSNADTGLVTPIAFNVTRNSYTWTIPTAMTEGKYKIIVSNNPPNSVPNPGVVGDSSDDVFSIAIGNNTSVVPVVSSVSPNSATAGDYVTVTGDHFLAGRPNDVTVNGTRIATVAADSTTQLRFQVTSGIPLMAGTYRLNVGNVNGVSDSNVTLTLRGPVASAPVITSITPSPLKVGDRYVIRGSGFVAGQQYIVYENGFTATEVNAVSTTELAPATLVAVTMMQYNSNNTIAVSGPNGRSNNLNFTLLNPATIRTITVNTTNGSNLTIGSTYQITWDTSIIPADYRTRAIGLIDANSNSNNVVALIADEGTPGWAGISTFNWKVGDIFNGSSLVRPGTYKIRVQYDDNFGDLTIPNSVTGISAGTITIR